MSRTDRLRHTRSGGSIAQWSGAKAANLPSVSTQPSFCSSVIERHRSHQLHCKRALDQHEPHKRNYAPSRMLHLLAIDSGVGLHGITERKKPFSLCVLVQPARVGELTASLTAI